MNRELYGKPHAWITDVNYIVIKGIDYEDTCH